jgi:hypothetical protein
MITCFGHFTEFLQSGAYKNSMKAGIKTKKPKNLGEKTKGLFKN